jgi:hypothetical protein
VANAAEGEGGGGWRKKIRTSTHMKMESAVIDSISMKVVLQSKKIISTASYSTELTMPGVRSKYRFCKVLWINMDSYE